MNERIRSIACLLALIALIAACAGGVGTTRSKLDVWEQKEIAEQAYVYAFPMIAAYKALYQFNIDTRSSQYKGPFNTIANEARVFTPKDTAIVTPNSDTPYSMVQMDLRAEPIVLCVPAVEKRRYYSIQLTDMYAFNYGYVGSRATGNDAGCYMVSGPDWKGEVPAGIAKVFPSETQFSLAIYRTQLFDPADIENVKKVQAGYRVQPLSAFLKQPAPPAPLAPKFPVFSESAFKTDFIAYLNFLMQFTPPVPEETALRARFAEIGIAPRKPYEFKSLPLEDRIGVGLGIKDGFESIQKRRNEIGTEANGYHGDYPLRAAAALAGIYGNDAIEALYPMAVSDSDGRKLDGSKYRYTITIPKDQFPPVNAFWSVTMYDGRTQLLVANPIDRYLINSPMLPNMTRNADGSLTIYIQKDSPGKAKESNWLPAPDGPIYMVMRLYWPKQAALDGTWKPVPIVRAK
jgi:hypothetical protein